MQQGTRRDLTADDGLPNPGEYGRDSGGGWYCAPPETWPYADLLGNLNNHTITEHQDGTITVSPSIEIKRWDGAYWHGFLERGVWRKL